MKNDRSRWINGLGLYLALLGLPVCCLGFADRTLSLAPVGGTDVLGGQLVVIEAFLSNDTASDQTYTLVQLDLPCTVAASGSGSLTISSQQGSIYPNEEGSAAGVPWLFSPGAIIGVNSADCKIATQPPLFNPPAVLPAGQTRYLATFNYEVSQCATGTIELGFENYTLPDGGQSSDQTRLRSGDGVVVTFNVVGTTLNVVGCTDGDFCTLNDVCSQEICAGTYTSMVFGELVTDLTPGVVEVEDLMCMVFGFAYLAWCPQGDIEPCGGDGDIDVDDLVFIVAAYMGIYYCPTPCP
jgi:hypothetical protein